VHKARIAAVFAAVRGLLCEGRLTVTAVGRGLATAGGEKHGIKRADRIVGNSKLHLQIPQFYRVLATTLLQRVAKVVVVGDWTEATTRRHCVLQAALAFKGRAIPLYAETHPMNRLSHTPTEISFFRRLKDILPPSCRPIIVLDAGFRPQTLKSIVDLGWDFVVRIRAGLCLRLTSSSSSMDWVRSRDLLDDARRGCRDLGYWDVTRKRRLRARVILADIRSLAARRVRDVKRRRNAARKASKAAREPWLLITTLAKASPRAITNLYALRMQVEETFRDTKNLRLGWSLEISGSRTTHRLNVLLLVGALATLATMLIGLAAEAVGAHRAYQANTIKKRRVLSLVTLGRRVLRREPPHLFLQLPLLLRATAAHLRELAP
jgi:hypothetical protein